MAKLTEEQKELNRLKRLESNRVKEEEKAKQLIFSQRLHSIEQERRHFIPNPTRQFQVGQFVEYGNHQTIEIIDVFDEGKFYEVHITGVVQEGTQGAGNPIDTTQIVSWYRLFPLSDNNERLFSPDKFQLNYYQSDINSLIHSVYGYGIDFDANYQRELVWDDEDKTALIDSIMLDRNIGNFLFMDLPFVSGEPDKQIVDGKQRLTTICEFFEDRFIWRGKKYSDFSHSDRFSFLHKKISKAQVKTMKEKDILELFLAVNDTGKPISREHLDKVRIMLDNIKE